MLVVASKKVDAQRDHDDAQRQRPELQAEGSPQQSAPSQHRAIVGFHDEAPQLRIARQILHHPPCQISSLAENLVAETSMLRNTRNQWDVGGAYEYFDCHANYLTPASFLLLLLELRMLGLTRMAGDVLPTVGCEFYATLSPLPQRDVAVSLNDYQEAKTRLRLQMFEELDDQLARLKASPAWEHYRRQPRQN